MTRAVFALAVGVWAAGDLFVPQATAQSVNIPLQYEAGGNGLILTINVGINGGAARPYLFDTGSGVFNAYYSAAAFGGISGNMAAQGLPTGLAYSYGDGSNPSNEFDSNLVKVPSLTFYATPTSGSGVTLNATTSNGSPSSFLVNAVYAHGGYINDATAPLAATSTFSGYYGIFGADALTTYFVGQGASTPVPTGQPTYTAPGPGVATGGVLGQAVVPGTTAGYVVAANGQSISSLLPPGATAPGITTNGPQTSHCAIASCDPTVILGLTPEVLAQFKPINTFAATQSGSAPPFPNSGTPALAHYPIDLSVTLSVPGQAPITFTQLTLLDSGTVNNQIFAPNFVSGHNVPGGATLTINGNAGGDTTSYNVTSGGGGPYGVTTNPPISNPDGSTTDLTYLGIGFFAQNSVLFNLAGAAIAYTPNYVTDQNVVTTPSAPLTIGSDSVPLGLAGVISGSGGLYITPGGSATLSGTNTYTGPTSINGGMLAVVGPGSIASSSGVNVSAGGWFDISGAWSDVAIQSLSGDPNGLVTLGSNTLVITNANDSYAGVIDGAGGLTLTGGVQVLSGINTYTGATTVDGGMLVVNGILAGTSNVTVNAGGILAGAGIIDPPFVTINSGGALAPGMPGVSGSSMMIVGNLGFQPGAIYMPTIGGNTASFVSVTGTASLAGTVAPVFSGPTVARDYTILTSNGLNGTTFNGVSAPESFIAGLSYDSNDVYLHLTANMAAAPDLGINQRNVARILDANFNAGTLPLAFGSAYLLSGNALSNAVSTLSGEATTGAQQSAFQMMNNFLGVMLDPFVDGRSGTGNADTANAVASNTSESPALAYASPGHGLPPELASAYSAIMKKPTPDAPQSSHWNVWGAAYGGSLSLSANGTTTGAHDVSAGAYGGATGADYRVTPDTTIGFALAGGGTDWNLSDGAGGGHSTAMQIGAYATKQIGAAYVAGALAFTNYWVTTNRNALGSDLLTANFGAQSFGGRAEAGYRYTVTAANTPAVTLTPYAAVQPQAFHSPAFSEIDTNGLGLALAYQSNDAVDTRTELGSRISTQVGLANGLALNLWGRLAWAHDFVSSPVVNATFQSLAGPSFLVYGVRPAENSALVSAGTEWHITPALSLLAKFDGQFAGTERVAAGSAALRYAW
jgi:autotransporter-associated beta strand protein